MQLIKDRPRDATGRYATPRTETYAGVAHLVDGTTALLDDTLSFVEVDNILDNVQEGCGVWGIDVDNETYFAIPNHRICKVTFKRVNS